MCVSSCGKGAVFKHILIYVRGADFCLLISHLDDHSIRLNQKKILSSTFPLLSLSFCWQRHKKEWIRERAKTTKTQSQRHKNERVTNQIPAWDLSPLLLVLIFVPLSSGLCQSCTPQPDSLRHEPAGHYPQSYAKSQSSLCYYHNEKTYLQLSHNEKREWFKVWFRIWSF